MQWSSFPRNPPIVKSMIRPYPSRHSNVRGKSNIKNRIVDPNDLNSQAHAPRIQWHYRRRTWRWGGWRVLAKSEVCGRAKKETEYDDDYEQSPRLATATLRHGSTPCIFLTRF